MRYKTTIHCCSISCLNASCMSIANDCRSTSFTLAIFSYGELHERTVSTTKDTSLFAIFRYAVSGRLQRQFIQKCAGGIAHLSSRELDHITARSAGKSGGGGGLCRTQP